MYIPFDYFRLSHVEKIGETGFETVIYYGKKSVGKASREDGKKSIEDIQVSLTKSAEAKMLEILKYRKKLKIDDEPVGWSFSFVVFCLMENKNIYDSIKRHLRHNKIIVQFDGDDFFSILNIANSPQNRIDFEKNTSRKILLTGEDFIKKYDEIKLFEQNL